MGRFSKSSTSSNSRVGRRRSCFLSFSQGRSTVSARPRQPFLYIKTLYIARWSPVFAIVTALDGSC
jgi:hypothetical protein